jgi:magnesium chelatase family protein
VPRVAVRKIHQVSPSTLTTAAATTLTAAARRHAAGRFASLGIRNNAEISWRHLRRVVRLSTEAEHFLMSAVEHYHLTARGYHRLLRVALTIADLAAHDRVETEDIAEALQFREMPAAQ